MSERKYTSASTGPKISHFLQTVLEDGGFKLGFEIEDAVPGPGDVETPDLSVKFSGADVDLLLSNRAEFLLALEHATMEALRMPSEDHSRIAFDANDYRLLRIEELRLSAMTVAENVKRAGTPFRFNPMNSRERRIIHLALRNETALRSESSGSGPLRHVVVYPAGMASLPDPPPSFGRPSSFGRSSDRGRERPRDGGRDGGRGRGGDRGGRGPRR